MCRDRIVSELVQELQQWLADTPSFFHPEKRDQIAGQPFYKVDWILQRFAQRYALFPFQANFEKKTAKDRQECLPFRQYATI